MDNQPNTADPKKVFDITPPNQTIPTATSRPIIVSNKPEQTDQMVQSPAPVTEVPSAVAEATESSAPVETITAEVADLPTEPDVSYETPTTPLSAGTVIEPQITGSTTNEIVTPSIYADTGSNQLSSSDIANASIGKSTEVEAPETSQQKVVVHKNTHNFGKSIFWLALIIIALVIVFDGLLDAGVLNISLPHTHFLQ